MSLIKSAWMLPLVLLLTLPACATMMGSNVPVEAPAVDSFCAIAKPISWVDADTDATIADVKAHNAVWKRLCR